MFTNSLSALPSAMRNEKYFSMFARHSVEHYILCCERNLIQFGENLRLCNMIFNWLKCVAKAERSTPKKRMQRAFENFTSLHVLTSEAKIRKILIALYITDKNLFSTDYYCYEDISSISQTENIAYSLLIKADRIDNHIKGALKTLLMLIYQEI